LHPFGYERWVVCSHCRQAYQKEIEKLKAELAKAGEGRPTSAAPEPLLVVDTEALDHLKRQHSTLSEQNALTQTQLMKKSRESV
jgi:hypothetical protein